MKLEKLFEGIYSIDGRLATVNMVKGSTVYGEELIELDGREYRLWNPYRSKLSAALMKGLKHMDIGRGSGVLYLGASTGTTSSHVSDIVGEKGNVFCVEISERSMRDLLKVCDIRKNMFPIFEDARNIEAYKEDVGSVDVIYQDVAARDQDLILLRNAELLKKNGTAYVAIKSQSIDISKRPSEVFAVFLKNVSVAFEILERIDIGTYDKHHLFVVLKKKID